MQAKNNRRNLLICSLAASCDPRPAEISDSVSKTLEGKIDKNFIRSKEYNKMGCVGIGR